MAKTSLQIAAAHVLRYVIDQGRSLDQALASQADRIGSDQVGALREMGYGGCRHYGYLNQIISSLLPRPLRQKDRTIHFLLVVGLYQIIHMRVPDHAAVHETVAALNATRRTWARGLVNGVLRTFLREEDDAGSNGFRSHRESAPRVRLPTHIYQWIQQAWPDHTDAICEAYGERPAMTLRVNRQKTTREHYLQLLQERHLPAERTSDSADGIHLVRPMNVDEIPRFLDGWVSVQDESAQLCTAAMCLRPALRVLDACAAPGGKACAMLESEPGIHLTAVDLPERMDSLWRNLQRIGLTAELQGNGLEALADWREHGLWDRILLDVPCSGIGVIRRHPDICYRRQPGDLERFAAQQLRLLELAWRLLVRGGRLLYVTCSILSQENDGVIDQFFDLHSEARAVPLTAVPGIRTRHGIQRLPGVHPGDGFFYCGLSKL